MTATSPRWLVLDVDDTLVRTFEVGLLKCSHVAKALGLEPPSAADLRRHYGRLSFERCVQLLHPGVDLAAYGRCYDGLHRQFPDRPTGDIAGLVRWARGVGARVGILTNGPRAKTLRKLSALGLDASGLDFVCDAENSAVLKPDVRAFVRLADEFGVDPGEAVFVSDSPAECAAAANAGFLAAGVLTGVWCEADFRRSARPPDLILAGVCELRRRIWTTSG